MRESGMMDHDYGATMGIEEDEQDWEDGLFCTSMAVSSCTVGFEMVSNPSERRGLGQTRSMSLASASWIHHMRLHIALSGEGVQGVVGQGNNGCEHDEVSRGKADVGYIHQHCAEPFS